MVDDPGVVGVVGGSGRVVTVDGMATVVGTLVPADSLDESLSSSRVTTNTTATSTTAVKPSQITHSRRMQEALRRPAVASVRPWSS